VSRLPLRLRLTLVFAAVMAAVLALMGTFVYQRVGAALLASADQTLRAGAAESADHIAHVDALADLNRPLVDPDTAHGQTLAQVLDDSGHVLLSSPAGLGSLVSASMPLRLRSGSTVRATTRLAGHPGEWRVYALHSLVAGHPVVLAVAISLEPLDETLHRLLIELLVASPIALLLASVGGYGLATAALRPVESMRRRAAAISASRPGQRLPVPASKDEIRRLAETLNDMLARLEASFEHERQFVADASHELRTPLALLRTELEVALRRPRSRAELEAALRSAVEESERLTRLAEDLLLIARSDQGGVPIRRERVDVDALLRSVADRFAARAALDDRAVAARACPGLAVEGDPARLEQALTNLVDNALTHGAGRIELFARSHDDAVELHVADQGPGIPSSFLSRAFERFSRGDQARGRGGAGLGLSIVEVIAQAHSGHAAATSRPDGGADVWLSATRAPLAASAVAADADAGD
jgi:two-component system, OmpR family, sensor kinase